jgi:hypothetical protein
MRTAQYYLKRLLRKFRELYQFINKFINIFINIQSIKKIMSIYYCI